MEDTFTINLHFDNGSIGTIHYFCNGHKSFPKERLEIFANGGIFVLDRSSHSRIQSKAFVPHTLFKQNKGQKECAEAFIDAVVSGLDSPIPLDYNKSS